jgi:hypothetical protein
VALVRRLENALRCSGRVLRASAATQSFVGFNSFYHCPIFCRTNGRSALRGFTLSNCTPGVQNAAFAGGR